MKRILFFILLLSGIAAEAQTDDSIRYTYYRYNYGSRYHRVQVDSILGIPKDTATNARENSIAVKNYVLYIKNATAWVPLISGIGSLNGLTGTTQTFTEGYGQNISSAGTAHTFTVDTNQVTSSLRTTHVIDSLVALMQQYKTITSFNSDTTNKWVQDVYARNDSLFKYKNGTETFIDSVGGSGSGGGDANLLVESLGATGEEIWRANNDTLYLRKIVAGTNVTIDTLATGEIEVSASGSAIDTSDVWLNNLYRRADSVFYVKGSTETFAYIDSTGGGGSGWGLTGNAGTTAGTNFIGTTDGNDFVAKVNNVEKLRLVNNANSLIKIGDDGASGTGILLDYGGNNSIRLRNTGTIDWYFSAALKYRFTASQLWVPMIATGPTFFTATALNHVAKGTTTVAPFKFTTASAALLTTPAAGALEVLVDSIYYTGSGATRKRLAYADEITGGSMPSLQKAIMVESPSASESLTFGGWRTPVDITISSVNAVLQGSSPSVTYNIAFGSDITSLTNVFTSGVTVTSTTTGLTSSSGFNDATIPAGSWVLLTTSASTNTNALSVNINYTED